MIVKITTAFFMGAVTLVFIHFGGLAKASQQTNPENELGLIDGKLRKCSTKPNCVCSQGDPSDSVHFIAPLKAVDLDDTKSRLLTYLKADKAYRVVEELEQYIRAEYRSKIFGFVDDVEFKFSPEEGLMHVRSASRVGYSDLGANRKRIEKIRKALN